MLAAVIHLSTLALMGYAAPAECPGEATFRLEVTKRTGGRAGAGDDVQIAITGGNGAGYDGKLVAAEGERTVHASTCVEVVQALALTAAISDTDEHDVPRPPPAMVVAPSEAAEAPPPPPSAQKGDTFAPVVGAGVAAVSGAAPGLTPQVSIFTGLDRRASSFRLSANLARSGDVDSPSGAATFTRWTAALQACPFGVAWTSTRLLACGDFEAGALVASGDSMVDGRSSTVPWLALGAGLRFAADLGRLAFLEVGGRVAVPLLRHDFYVRPDVDVFHVPAVAGEATIALGMRFPK